MRHFIWQGVEGKDAIILTVGCYTLNPFKESGKKHCFNSKLYGSGVWSRKRDQILMKKQSQQPPVFTEILNYTLQRQTVVFCSSGSVCYEVRKAPKTDWLTREMDTVRFPPPLTPDQNELGLYLQPRSPTLALNNLINPKFAVLSLFFPLKKANFPFILEKHPHIESSILSKIWCYLWPQMCSLNNEIGIWPDDKQRSCFLCKEAPRNSTEATAAEMFGWVREIKTTWSHQKSHSMDRWCEIFS